jgi:NADH-quinone oxidoreductase subunit F
MGYSLRKAIYDVAGGIKGGKQLKAVVPGGASCPVLRADEIDVGLDFDQMAKAGTMLGSGGIVVLDETVSIVEFALRTIKFYQHESCGWCIPCREGTDWIKKTLTRVYEGGGQKKDIDNVQYLAENMMGRTFCPLGDAAAMPTLGFVKKFRKEFEDYIDGKKAGTPVMTTEQDWLERVIEPSGPSNFVTFAVMARGSCAGVVCARRTRTHPQRSADQKILIEKSHQH